MIIFKKYGLSFLALFIYLLSNAQSDFSLLSKWDYTPSGNYERINKVIAASNGQLFAVGETSDPYSKTFYGLLLILNEDGTVHLRQRFGSSGQSSFNAVVQNFDGTFTLVGYSRANARSAKKGWVVQVDLDGKEIFNKVIRSAWKGDDELIDVATNGKGELLAVGSQDDMRSHDLWLVRIDNKEISDRQIGRGELGPVTGIVGGADGSFVLLGNVSKKNKKYYQDAWVKKIDQNGDDLWGGPRYLGGKGLQQGNDITKVAAGGYAIAGTIGPNGGGATDKWLVKLNNKGETVWTRTFGGAADDVASAVVELSEGGFALVGQTLSYLQRAKYSAADIILTDANGKELDSETYITGASGGHEIGLSVVEAYNGDLIATGCLIPEKSSQLSHVFLSAHSYKPFTAPKRSGRAKEEVYGDALSHALQVSNTTFVDADNNQSLDAGERGYFMLEVANQSDTKLEEVSGKISASSATAQIDVWETVQIGTLQPGQKKQIIVPVKATKSIPRGEYTFGIALESKGAILTSTTAKLSSNRPDPAKLVADGSFSPLKNPSPGETISLNVEILNTGGLASVPTEAYFRIPVGVQSLGSEKISIPALPPHSSHRHCFKFKFKNTFHGKTLDVQFETIGKGMSPILKTFQLELSRQPDLVKVPDEMFWVSHDPDEAGSRNFAVNTNEIGIKVKVISRKELNKRNFSVLLNSRKAQGQKMDEVDLTKPVNDMGRFRQTYTNKIRLKEGLNKVIIEYDYGDGSKFKSRELTFNYTPQGQPRLLVISIGVPYENLKYTTKDAQDFATLYESLKGVKQGFKEVDVNVFNTKAETKTNTIREVFEKLSHHRRSGFKLKKEDLLVIYISAHGKVNNRGEFLLMPSDYKSEAEKTYSINFENDILQELKYVDCKKLVFVDACHSGSAFNGTKDWNSEDAASKVMNDLIRTAPGIEIIASCSYNEYSYEDESWGNGAFTKAISEAFTNKRVAVDGGMTSADILMESGSEIRSGSDGKISIQELKQFIQKRVPYLVKTTKINPPTGQNPSNKSTDLLPENMGIYYLGGR